MTGNGDRKSQTTVLESVKNTVTHKPTSEFPVQVSQTRGNAVPLGKNGGKTFTLILPQFNHRSAAFGPDLFT